MRSFQRASSSARRTSCARWAESRASPSSASPVSRMARGSLREDSPRQRVRARVFHVKRRGFGCSDGVPARCQRWRWWLEVGDLRSTWNVPWALESARDRLPFHVERSSGGQCAPRCAPRAFSFHVERSRDDGAGAAAVGIAPSGLPLVPFHVERSKPVRGPTRADPRRRIAGAPLRTRARPRAPRSPGDSGPHPCSSRPRLPPRAPRGE